MKRTVLTALLFALAACSPVSDTARDSPEVPTPQSAAPAAGVVADDGRRLLWGDTHVHTNYSMDAYFLGNRTADPDTAYRFARGLPVVHPGIGVRTQIDRPLDFLVIADHAENMGVGLRLASGDPDLTATETGARFAQMLEDGQGRRVFGEIVTRAAVGRPLDELELEPVRASVWDDIVSAAESHNQPGEFTALIGWEWTSLIDGANQHRVVFTPDGGDVARRFIPFSAIDSPHPEDLWTFLEETSEATGARFIAMPHNSNVSKGTMFPLVDSAGDPIDADYARRRMLWEPVVEITQNKGDSETHPVLSPTDEFADFETFPSLIDTRPRSDKTPTTTDGDYVRGALRRGLEIEAETGINPYAFGVIGSTDAHTGLSSVAEGDSWLTGVRDATVPGRQSARALPSVTGWTTSAQGLAAVWSDSNTREAIYEAFKRREVYATTGPRISVRVFAGWDFDEDDLTAPDFVNQGYARGVPMGGDMTPSPDGGSPTFLIVAERDPATIGLDRVQIIKGWIDGDGETHERIHNVAWSGRGGDKAEALSPLPSTVDLSTGDYDRTSGAEGLSTAWRDPDFDPAQSAFYYLRVLEAPTPRHSLLDAIAMGADPEITGMPPVIQERVYTSPIWYRPGPSQ